MGCFIFYFFCSLSFHSTFVAFTTLGPRTHKDCFFFSSHSSFSYDDYYPLIIVAS